MASHLDDGDLAAAMCRAYNNYVAEQSRGFNGRIRPVAAVALQNPVEAAKEVRRAVKDLGLVGTVVTGTVRAKKSRRSLLRSFFP